MRKAKLFLYYLFGMWVTVIAIKWLFRYYYDGTVGLKPELLFEMSVEEYNTKRFSTNNFNRVWLMHGLEIDSICRSRGFKSELRGTKDSFFAVCGNKAIRFIPEKFHYVKGGIEFELADSNKVYFYRYRARYYPIVLQP